MKESISPITREALESMEDLTAVLPLVREVVFESDIYNQLSYTSGKSNIANIRRKPLKEVENPVTEFDEKTGSRIIFPGTFSTVILAAPNPGVYTLDVKDKVLNSKNSEKVRTQQKGDVFNLETGSSEYTMRLRFVDPLQIDTDDVHALVKAFHPEMKTIQKEDWSSKLKVIFTNNEIFEYNARKVTPFNIRFPEEVVIDGFRVKGYSFTGGKQMAEIWRKLPDATDASERRLTPYGLVANTTLDRVTGAFKSHK